MTSFAPIHLTGSVINVPLVATLTSSMRAAFNMEALSLRLRSLRTDGGINLDSYVHLQPIPQDPFPQHPTPAHVIERLQFDLHLEHEKLNDGSVFVNLLTIIYVWTTLGVHAGLLSSNVKDNGSLVAQALGNVLREAASIPLTD